MQSPLTIVDDNGVSEMTNYIEETNGECAPTTFKQFSFVFKPGTVNGRPAHFVQYWLTDAMFSIMHQGWFDNYAFKFKFKTDDMPPSDLAAAIQSTYVAVFNPVKKDFRD
jgi:hypothetical protein